MYKVLRDSCDEKGLEKCFFLVSYTLHQDFTTERFCVAIHAPRNTRQEYFGFYYIDPEPKADSQTWTFTSSAQRTTRLKLGI